MIGELVVSRDCGRSGCPAQGSLHQLVTVHVNISMHTQLVGMFSSIFYLFLFLQDANLHPLATASNFNHVQDGNANLNRKHVTQGITMGHSILQRTIARYPQDLTAVTTHTRLAVLRGR